MCDWSGIVSEMVHRFAGGDPGGNTYILVTNVDHHDRLRRHPFHRIQIPQTIHTDHAPIPPLTRTQSPRAMILPSTLHLVHPIQAPHAHKLIVVVTLAQLRALPPSRPGGAGRLCLLPKHGAAQAIREGMQRLAEAAFARSVERFRIGDDALGTGVGVEEGIAWDVIDGGGHAGFARLLALVAVVGAAAGGGGGGGVASVAVVMDVFRVGRGAWPVAGEEGVDFVLSGGGHGTQVRRFFFSCRRLSRVQVRVSISQRTVC